METLIEGDEIRKFSDYFEYVETLGQGAFGLVVKAINIDTQQIVAIKIIKKKLVNRYDLIKQESTILSSLKHENIVKFIDFKETDTRILIIMELMEGGSLEDFFFKMIQKNEWFNEDQCKTIIRSILQALVYIHQNNVVHRDLKPENVLIKEDLSSVKLSDFGLSSVQNSLMTKQCGTLIYMAPELLMNKIYNKSVDIWSVGIIMYMLLNRGQHPYYKNGDTMEQILQNTKIMHNNTNMTQLQYSLFKKLTELDQSKRYRADQGLLHPWLNDQGDGDIPQTMEEIFNTWIHKQQLLNIIKCLMVIQKFGYDKKLQNKELCNKYSDIKFKLKQDKNKKDGKFILNKEFYDELFEDYQKTLTEQQKKQVIINQNEQQQQKSQLSTVQQKLQFIIRTRKPSQSSKNIDEPKEQQIELDINESQPEMLEQENLNDNSQIEKSEHNMSVQITSAKSPKKKRKSPIKTQIKIFVQKNESLNNSQHIIKEKPISNINSPIKNNNNNSINNNNQSTKYQIKLKPLQTQIEVSHQQQQQQQQQQQPLQTNITTVIPIESNYRSAIRPRQTHIPRLSRLSVDRDQVQPAILDLSSMALGGFSPVHSNQFLFPSKIPSYCPPKRVYQNEFHPSKVLTSLASKKQNDHYNFINGGPK